MPLPTRAVAIPAADATMSRPTRAAAIPAGAATTAAGALTTLAGSTPAEAITTVDASGLVLTLASGSASHSAGATLRVPDVATMTDTATGSQLRAIRPSPRSNHRMSLKRHPPDLPPHHVNVVFNRRLCPDPWHIRG